MSELLLTSNEWEDKSDTIILDPDGWDRKGGFYYSWYEERITQSEYDKRRMISTCVPKGAGWDRT